MVDMGKMGRIAAVSRAFTPGAPVSKLDMLSGRFDQLQDIIQQLSSAGKHVALYGERGVGKTSLVNVLAEAFNKIEGKDSYRAVVVNCNSADTFRSIWRSVFLDLQVDIDDLDVQAFTPEGIRRFLQSRDRPIIVVLDELDRLEDDDALTALSDTIKTLSDHVVDSKIILVGVASSISELVGEHESIGRALAQIGMPRMSHSELGSILASGGERAGLTMDPAVVREIVSLSEGLPHYTHLLGLKSGERAAKDDRDHVGDSDLVGAISDAIKGHTNRDRHQQAIRSTRNDTLFESVLLACSLTQKNALGYFKSGAVRDPLEAITGRRIEIPQFSKHLKDFMEPERGAVLQRTGTPRRFFYRFADPMFQPYVILDGLASGRLTEDQRKEFRGVELPPELTADLFDTDSPPKLF